MSEKLFHQAFEKWLRSEGLIFVTSAMHKATSQTCGEPDYFVIENSKVLCLELKIEKNKLSPAQVKRHAEYAATGTKVHVVRDIAVAVELVRQWRSTLGETRPIDAPKFPTTIYGGRRYDISPSGELFNGRAI